jgi:nucleoside-triphosphatase THEP1
MGRIESTPNRFARIIFLTGRREVGKTSLILKVLEELKGRRLDAAGVVSPAIFLGETKIGIDLQDIRSNERRRLADLRVNQTSEIMTERWSFVPETLDWGNQVLLGATPCDLLIVDELGPIELERDQGLTNGIHAIDSGNYQAAVIVIRPELIAKALQSWPSAQVLEMAGGIETMRASLMEMTSQLIKHQ